ncbi:MAG: hypothetical protein BJ554DRAFT_1645 [Olpidium bornovanus]|uniref:Uncharacterized protein n=1 Tax=Olpidium bornovanus TaxID=278681 RepID=A0A8H8DHJ5_9FUNG|nr:MAG: hypothetical protein BJ554DRAFT_1645 [Olpidium bornovanus]
MDRRFLAHNDRPTSLRAKKIQRVSREVKVCWNARRVNEVCFDPKSTIIADILKRKPVHRLQFRLMTLAIL